MQKILQLNTNFSWCVVHDSARYFWATEMSRHQIYFGLIKQNTSLCYTCVPHFAYEPKWFEKKYACSRGSHERVVPIKRWRHKIMVSFFITVWNWIQVRIQCAEQISYLSARKRQKLQFWIQQVHRHALNGCNILTMRSYDMEIY